MKTLTERELLEIISVIYERRKKAFITEAFVEMRKVIEQRELEKEHGMQRVRGRDTTRKTRGR